MSKKILLLIILITLILPAMGQKKKLSSKSVFFKNQSEVLIGRTDLYCTCEIVKRISTDIEIIGSEEMNQSKSQYTTGDRVFINKGNLSGLKTGDRFEIFALLKRVFSPGSLKLMGRLIQRKGIGVISEIFEDRAIITLEDTCFPVELTDNLIPFKEGEKIVRKSIDYKKTKLMDSYLKGKIIFSYDNSGVAKMTSSSGDIVISNLGMGEVSKGDFILFYKIFKRNLPKVVIGSGIVLKPQSNNSTIKIIDVSLPISIGENIAVVPAVSQGSISVVEQQPPLLKKSEEISQEIKKTEETFNFAILFDINETKISDKYDDNFNKLKSFIDSKSEISIILRGYACSIGNFEYNMELSNKRVTAVKNILISKYNIPENLIETFFYGEKDSPFDNSSEESRRKNRRVDIQVIGK